MANLWTSIRNVPLRLLGYLLCWPGIPLPSQVLAAMITKAALNELLRLYRKYDLPFPPDNAVLVKFPTGVVAWEKDGQHYPQYAFGFWLNADAPQTYPRIVFGTQVVQMESRPRGTNLQRVDPQGASLDHIDVQSRGSKIPLNAGLATALQCHARGWTTFAQQLAQVSVTAPSYDRDPDWVTSVGEWIYARKNKLTADRIPVTTPHSIFAGMVWNHFLNEIVRAGSNWHELAPKMKLWLESEPTQTDDNKRAVVASLEAALRPRTAEAASVEALIDELMDQPVSPDEGGPPEAPAIGKLKAMGFTAVPALIEHLSDERMTRSTISAFNTLSDPLQRVGDLAAGILQTIAGQDFSKDWLAARVGNGVAKADVLDWWQLAQKTGEEKYAIDHLFSSLTKTKFANRALLSVITQKYPQRLPALYGMTLDNYAEDYGLAEALGASSLSSDVKLRSLEHGLANAHAAHQIAALRVLQGIDPARADTALVQYLEKLPAKTKGAVRTSPEARVAHLVKKSDSPAVWAALLAAAQRASIGLRMELMRPMHYSYIGDQQRRERLAFLAAFLDDDEVRVTDSDPEFYKGPCAGFTFDRLSVRDLAATSIASMLRFPDEPKPDWTVDQWADLRAKVRRALAEEE